MTRTNYILGLMFLTVLIGMGTQRSIAQTAPLPLGSMQINIQMGNNCPAGFYTGTQTNPATCYDAQITCPNANPIDLTFSYINGAAPNTPTGTIVLFAGGGGQITQGQNNAATAQDYALAKYAVVQSSWATDWENTNGGYVMIQPPPAFNVLTAACRPATFLNYIATNSQYHATGTGMCADAASAGSAAVGYSLVW